MQLYMKVARQQPFQLQGDAFQVLLRVAGEPQPDLLYMQGNCPAAGKQLSIRM